MKRQEIDEYFAGGVGPALRLDYPSLGPNSTVFDLGGYRGDWTASVLGKYGCKVHVFEFVPEFARGISARFSLDDRVVVHEFGLGSSDRTVPVRLSGDASGESAGASDAQCRVVRAVDFLRSSGISDVSLAKINIEGGEYDLLEHLLEEGAIGLFDNLQVQFHKEVPGSEPRLKRIRERLSSTHECTWCFEWVFENWKRK